MKPLAALALLPALAAAATATGGTVPQPHVSGAAPLRDGRLVVTAEGINSIFLMDEPGAVPNSLAPQLKGKIALEDVEDAAAGGPDELFVIGSHARDRFGEAPEGRYRLGRLRFDATGRLLEAAESGALLEAIRTEVPFLADSIRRTPARSGLNVEGLAFTPEGHLLVGLRAPTITESTPRPHGGQEDAVVLRIKNPDALFERPPAPALLGETLKLDLRGQGIRGLAYDAEQKGVWILSGLSAEPTHPVSVPWGLWYWDQRREPVEVVPRLEMKLAGPEAVCPIRHDGRPHLLLIDDGDARSRWTLIPTPEVPK